MGEHCLSRILDTVAKSNDMATMKLIFADVFNITDEKKIVDLAKNISQSGFAAEFVSMWEKRRSFPLKETICKIMDRIPLDSVIFTDPAIMNINDHVQFIEETIDSKNIQRAHALLHNSIKLFPDERILYQKLSHAAQAMGNMDEALVAAQKALELTPKTSSTVELMRERIKSLGGVVEDGEAGKSEIKKGVTKRVSEDKSIDTADKKFVDRFGVTAPSMRTIQREDLIEMGNVELSETIQNVEAKIAKEKTETKSAGKGTRADYVLSFIKAMELDVEALKDYLEAREQAIAAIPLVVPDRRSKDSEATRKVEMGKVMSILNYKLEDDYNSVEEIPIPGVVFMNNPRILLDHDVQELMNLIREKRKISEGESLSEDYKLSLKCLKLYIDARIKLDKKLIALAEAAVNEKEIAEEAVRKVEEDERVLEQIGSLIQSEMLAEEEMLNIAAQGEEEERLEAEARASEEAAVKTDKHGIEIPNFKYISRKEIASSSIRELENAAEDLRHEIRKLQRLEVLTLDDEVKLVGLREDDEMLEQYFTARLDAEPRDLPDGKKSDSGGAEAFFSTEKDHPTPAPSSDPPPFRPSFVEDLTDEVTEDTGGGEEAMAKTFGIDNGKPAEHKSDVPIPPTDYFDLSGRWNDPNYGIADREEDYQHCLVILESVKENEPDNHEKIEGMEADLRDMQETIDRLKEEGGLSEEADEPTESKEPVAQKETVECASCSTIYSNQFPFCVSCGEDNPNHENIGKYVGGSKASPVAPQPMSSAFVAAMTGTPSPFSGMPPIKQGLPKPGERPKVIPPVPVPFAYKPTEFQSGSTPETAENPKIKLMVVGKVGEVLSETVFDQNVIKIGKMASCHFQINDEKIGRMHAVIENEGQGKIFIIDLGTVAGTLVNGVRVNKSHLKPGDAIKIGDTEILFGLTVPKEEIEEVEELEGLEEVEDANLPPAVEPLPVVVAPRASAPEIEEAGTPSQLPRSSGIWANADDLIVEEDDANIEPVDLVEEEAPITDNISMLDVGEKLIVEGRHPRLAVTLAGDSIRIKKGGWLTVGMLNVGARIYMEKGATLIIEKASDKCEANPVEVVRGCKDQESQIIFREGVPENCVSSLTIG